MFSNTSPKTVLSLITNMLKGRCINRVLAKKFVAILKLCFKQNYFKFGGKYYNMEKGLIIGLQISPLAADTFTVYFEFLL